MIYATPMTIKLGDKYSNDPLRRFVTYERSWVGIYFVKVKYLNGSTSAIESNKLAISFIHRKVEVYQKSSGGDGTYSFAEFGIKSYTPAGVLSDGMIKVAKELFSCLRIQAHPLFPSVFWSY